MNEDTMDESTDIVNQRSENEISSHMELPDTKIEEYKVQNLPEAEIEENIEQVRERQGCEDIPATAALLLQNNSGNKSILKESELSGENNSDKKETIETCPIILTEKALHSDVENQQTENEISSPMELPDTKIEEQREQNLPDPEIEENVEQARERQGCEDIPAIAALLLQNCSENKSILKESEFSGKINSDKKETIEICPIILTENALPYDVENQQTENEISSPMELPDTKIEEQREQHLPEPEIEENVEQGRERHGCEDIPAIAALLLQNSSENKEKLEESEFLGINNCDKIETIVIFPKILTEKALHSDVENQQTENEISSPMELPDIKIEEQKEQNLPEPEIEENLEQGRERQGCEDIPAIAALLLQNSSENKAILKESEFLVETNSDKQETIETCPIILTKNALPSDVENQQTENEISSPMELPDTEIEEQNEQNHLNPEVEESVEQGRSRQGCEDIPAIAAFLLQNSISNKSKLNKDNEFSDKNLSDKNDSIESGPKTLSKAPTNGLPIDQDEGKDTMKGSPLPDSELENSNSCQEKILSNSKDSSMLSTTDTQDEIETIDNGDQIYMNHLDDQADIAAQSKLAKQQLLAMSNSDDSLDGMMETDFDHRTEESFSIVSVSEYDETSQSSIQEKHFENPVKDIDKAMGENRNEKPKFVEIEIDTQNITAEDNNGSLTHDKNKTGQNKKNGNSVKPELRRSSRTVKLRKYSYDEQNDDEDSEMEESDSDDTLKIKSRPIMINDTKSLVEIAARQAARSTASDRREPQLVLIGSKPKAASAPTLKNTSSSIHSSLYQSIVARGTTVTPVPSKPAATTTSQAVQTSPTPTPVLLPSLTDDMFVVEAPSFIVPYVYEKPSVKPFKEFVTELGKDIEVQRAKAEKELLEKKVEEKLKVPERIDQGEEVIDPENEARREDEKKIKIAKKEKRQHGREEDESSWDDFDSSDSDDFKITDDSGTTVVIEKDELVEDIKKIENVPAPPSNSNTYFDGSLGQFFTNIGMGLVEEYVQRDLLKTQQRKLQREKKAGHITKESELVKSISLLMKNYEISKQNNQPLKCIQIKCEYCTFETESEIVLAQHMETPHMKNNMYKCNFCEFEIRSPHDILFHMEAEHNVRGRLERAPAYHQCVNCPFEDNGKGKLARHGIACAKKFKPEYNLSPPADWEPPAKIPKVTKGRQTMLGAPIPLSGPFGRSQPSMNPFSRPPISNMLLTTSTSNYRPRARVPGQIMTRPVIAGGSIVRGCSIQQQNAAAAQAAAIAKKNHPSISITPVPSRPVLPALPPHESATATFVICEICDGYIKDLEQLRNHMQWIHRVKIHPKMIYNRPPLNCQKCQFRFFTDMGLERHLLGSHGLVTSSMQDAANKNKDAGRCPVCGKVFQWKLLNHMAKDHGMTLKPAHLSYKCTVCSATFEMYKLFENHVYSAHSVVAKRVMDKAPVKAKSNNIPKGLKINDEITITAQPARPSKEK